MNKNIDYRLYLVTDRKVLGDTPLEIAVENAIKGGVTLVQIREKDCLGKEFLQYAKDVKKVTDKYNVPLIVNDRVDIALAIGAAGVHVGQNDMDASYVRNIIKDNMILGVSVSNKEDAIKAVKDGADYVGVGAIYETTVKLDAVSVKLNMLKEIVDSIDIPVVAIGGINEKNIEEVLSTNIDGVAVISAILRKKDIINASINLLNAYKK